MAIISPLTYTITNGQAVDAVPLMADLNQIVSNVNANAAALAGSSSQVFNVANATTSTEAVNLGQAQADFAALNGSSSQVFNVANATTSTEAVALGQFVASFTAQGYIKLPGGFILQWGTITQASALTSYNGLTWTFPIAFPTAALTCFGILEDSGNLVSPVQIFAPSAGTALTATSATYTMFNGSSTAYQLSARVFALGY